MFAGSILDLEPDTEYEARLSCRIRMVLAGRREKTVTVRTRPEPKPYAGGRMFHVYPHGFKGTEDPAGFRGFAVRLLSDLLGYGLGHGFPAPRAAGRHDSGSCRAVQIRSLNYTNDLSISTVPFDGTYYLTASGTRRSPIAIKAAGDGEVDLRRERGV